MHIPKRRSQYDISFIIIGNSLTRIISIRKLSMTFQLTQKNKFETFFNYFHLNSNSQDLNKLESLPCYYVSTPQKDL